MKFYSLIKIMISSIIFWAFFKMFISDVAELSDDVMLS